MTTLHTIRLNGFWTVTEPQPGWVRYTRNFGQPRTQDPNESHWLVGRGLPGHGRVFVNDESVGEIPQPSGFACELRELKPRNRVAIELQTTADQPLGEITLEIRTS